MKLTTAEKAKKYDSIILKRKLAIKKYHQSEGGVKSTRRATQTYYDLNREKILAKKKIRYNKLKLERANAQPMVVSLSN